MGMSSPVLQRFGTSHGIRFPKEPNTDNCKYRRGFANIYDTDLELACINSRIVMMKSLPGERCAAELFF